MKIHNCYRYAIEILQEWFGKTQRIITSHMDELLKILSCTSDRASSLRNVFDKVSVHVRDLALLSVSADQYGSLLTPIIVNNLPSNINLEIARKAYREVWQTDELPRTIGVKLEAREASEANKTTKDNLGRYRAQKLPDTTNSICLLQWEALLSSI